MGIYSQYQIPDPGETLVRVVGEIAGVQIASTVAAEVDRLRRSDGSIVSADMSNSKREKHSPLNSLGGLLGYEEIVLSAWSELAFGMMQKRSAIREVKRIWQDQGLDSAVQWVMANGKHRPNLAVLADGLAENARSPMGHLENAFRQNLTKDLRKWSRNS
ncbi:hypothetical protein ACQ856_28640 (plasmid) [Mycolicibacterium psychrotolerans]|uniref:hypothetical protein n=1 Tax=Mycolicibacterium psychrotolerans TaxID=216929 RepID=UPI003D67D045